MKKFNARELVLLMLGFCVSMSILVGIVGMVFKGSTTPSPDVVAVRVAIIDLLKYIVAGIVGIIAYKGLTKNDKDDN